MQGHTCPQGYVPMLDLRATQQAIKVLKDCFQQQLGASLNLTRVSAPLFVRKLTGLNDDLSGVERKVAFDLKELPGTRCRWSSPWPSGSATPWAATAIPWVPACIPT